MPVSQSLVRVFLSSPGDVGAHREAVREVIQRLNSDPLISRRCSLQVVGWDQPGAAVPLNALQTPQLSVNDYVALPSECDVTIVLLWGRLGTPLPAALQRRGGGRYPSGTIWELEDARNAGREVWLYRKTLAPQLSIDDPDWQDKRAQYQAVKDFVNSSKAADGSLNFGVHEFENDEQLRTQVTEHIKQFISKTLRAGGPDTILVPAPPPPDIQADPVSGAVEIAISGDNDWRRSHPYDTGGLHVFDLKDYPIGPMIRDLVIHHLPEAIAELTWGTDVRGLFADINARLAEARRHGEPELRLSRVMFPTTVGNKFFWEDVLHTAGVQGPRMLASVLSLLEVERIDGLAREELATLIKRVNSYV